MSETGVVNDIAIREAVKGGKGEAGIGRVEEVLGGMGCERSGGMWMVKGGWDGANGTFKGAEIGWNIYKNFI